MKKLFVTLSFLILVICISSQSWALPPCNTNININKWDKCVGENWDKSGFYRGEFFNGIENGVGELRINKKRWHRGNFFNGKFHGLGVRIDTTGNTLSIVIGNWKNGILIKGLLVSKYGKYYGNWNNQKFDGKGFFIDNKSKITFGNYEEGTLINNQLKKNADKKCKKNEMKKCFGLKGKEDNFVAGEFESKKLNGYGYIKDKNFEFFGIFKNNTNIGNGAMIFKNGDLYYGNFKGLRPFGSGLSISQRPFLITYLGNHDKHGLNGNGVMFADNNEENTLKHMSSYFGKFKNHEFSGAGLKISNKGSFFYGEWKFAMPNGIGFSVAEDGKYVGDWVNGQKQGLGLLIKNRNNTFVGELINNKPHGMGVMYHKNKENKEGQWGHGKFLTKSEVDDKVKKYVTSSPTLENFSSFYPNLLKNKEQKSKSSTIVKNQLDSKFSNKSINVNFKSISKRPDDIAVIIGNANYKKMGKDIPNVNPAYADAAGIKQYFMKAKGIKEGNIIYLKDATGSQLASVFGNEKSYKGKLFNYIKPNKSNVYIYYAGHGAPGEEGDAYLVPTDTDSQTIQFTGYQLSTLYSNLGKLPAKSVTVILEACFSGGSQSGSLISKASPIVITPKKTMIPANVKVIAAGSERQMASWEEDSSHSLFTKYFLKAMSGEGDSNKDGKVSDAELKEYLSDTMTYYARRYYGRDQKVQIHNGG
ncbi:caspase family protein [Candidatus Levibacter sp. Uisw_134_01]|uniref:caspase family protein n=1 Tax=Candidatus Levibacter sp. Uisw_134_01 TaxID=3230999 RepID=UPI003D4D1BFA